MASLENDEAEGEAEAEAKGWHWHWPCVRNECKIILNCSEIDLLCYD